MTSALVLLSGGQDSTTALLWAKSKFGAVRAVSFRYGQRHLIELKQAAWVCAELGVPYEEVTLPVMRPRGDSPVVEGRNPMMLTMAAARAKACGAADLVVGYCVADARDFPDCRLPFVRAMETALSLAMEMPLAIHAPYIGASKADLFAEAAGMAALPLILEHTHTCYVGDRSVRHPWGYGCGACQACRARMNGWTEYQALKGAGT